MNSKYGFVNVVCTPSACNPDIGICCGNQGPKALNKKYDSSFAPRRSHFLSVCPDKHRNSLYDEVHTGPWTRVTVFNMRPDWCIHILKLHTNASELGYNSVDCATVM